MAVSAVASCQGFRSEGCGGGRVRARQSESRRRPGEVLRTPAVSQEQRDGEQPWVLAGGLAGHTSDEHVEVVADVEFFEQQVQQSTRQSEAARAFC